MATVDRLGFVLDPDLGTNPRNLLKLMLAHFEGDRANWRSYPVRPVNYPYRYYCCLLILSALASRWCERKRSDASDHSDIDFPLRSYDPTDPKAPLPYAEQITYYCEVERNPENYPSTPQGLFPESLKEKIFRTIGHESGAKYSRIDLPASVTTQTFDFWKVDPESAETISIGDETLKVSTIPFDAVLRQIKTLAGSAPWSSKGSESAGDQHLEETDCKSVSTTSQQRKLPRWLTASLLGVLLVGTATLVRTVIRSNSNSTEQNYGAHSEESDTSYLVSQKKASTSDPVGDQLNATSKREKSITLNRVTIDCVLIEPGEFTMGEAPADKSLGTNEIPVHRVRFTKQFWMGKYEVTQAQWKSVFGKDSVRDRISDPRLRGENKPMIEVNWKDCVEFCRRISKPGLKVRLPTEAEWEYACRAGSSTRYAFGNVAEELYKYGNYCDRSNKNQLPYQDKAHDDHHDKLAPVGSFRPNAWNLHDLHGNVWEWCQDKYHKNYNGMPSDGAAWESGRETARVIRGGSWYHSKDDCRSARRSPNDPKKYEPDYRSNSIGFRVVVEVE
jgi:formylglycine-generating enzyme required for sulfatase activity